MDSEPRNQRQIKKEGKNNRKNAGSCYTVSHIRKQVIATENAQKKRNSLKNKNK
jgi:hypothetical protein